MLDASPGALVFLVLAGLFAGAVNAVAGGGSLLVFPALLAVGFPPLAANVTNSVAQWPGYLGIVVGVRQELRGQRRRILLTSTVGVAGSAVGCVLLLILPDSVFDAVVPVLVLLASAVLALQPRIKRWIGAPEAGAPDRWAALLPAVFAAAIYGGYFGGALGVILIATLSLCAHDRLVRLNALKGLLSLVIATRDRRDLRVGGARGLAGGRPARPHDAARRFPRRQARTPAPGDGAALDGGGARHGGGYRPAGDMNTVNAHLRRPTPA